ncbi:MAG: hypothetical protein JW981_01125 [Anaerolineae bacterium]|nr:hypothetical protein [Anaerolineae bacterium]
MREENVVLYDSKDSIEKPGGSETPVIIDVEPEPVNIRSPSLSPRTDKAVELVQKGIIVLGEVLRLASSIVQIKDNLRLATRSDTARLRDTAPQVSNYYSAVGKCGRQRRSRRRRGRE